MPFHSCNDKPCVMFQRVIIYSSIWIESVMLSPPRGPPSLSLQVIQPSVFCFCSDSSSLLQINPFLRLREQED